MPVSSALILLMILGGGTLLNRRSGNAVPQTVSIIAGMVIQSAVGAWYFVRRARSAGGEALNTKGAALLALLAYALIVSVGLLAGLTLSVLVP